MTAQTVHPFPARMAPELADNRLDMLSTAQTVLDPMMGSGTFVLKAAARGHLAIGADTDPMAHIITAAAARAYDPTLLQEAASVRAAATADIGSRQPSSDPATNDFVDFWFDADTRDKLAALAFHIPSASTEHQPALWCAFSRLIITKDSGASLARDVSHSRPHRVRTSASFNPLDRFEQSVALVARRALGIPDGKLPRLLDCDARALQLGDGSVDHVMTSPPYLVAIDYLRGHRLALVWMGYSIGGLRRLRGENIGTERGSDGLDLKELLDGAVEGDLRRKQSRILNQYATDMHALCSELVRVLVSAGTATFVVANAQHGTGAVSVERVLTNAAAVAGFRLDGRTERLLPADRRYLPPPGGAASSLSQRMKSEVIVTFQKSESHS